MTSHPWHLASPGHRSTARLNVVVLDLETTGKYPTSDTITEIAAVRRPAEWFTRSSATAPAAPGAATGSGQGEGSTFTTLVNPHRPIPPVVQELTGITDGMVVDAPALSQALPELVAFSQGCLLVAHNAHFDLSFLAAGCSSLGIKTGPILYLDTLKVSRKVLGKTIANHRLATLAQHFLVSEQPTHRALADVSATEQVLRGLLTTAHNRIEGAEDGLFPSQPSWQVLSPFIEELPTLAHILDKTASSSTSRRSTRHRR